ncbi:hypothetical protein [Paenibacillus tyrfis]|nr:hypothetical protein [Paenibacillus tyrfis]MCP1312427.1 hypothetical protein [Paenibacillus tyrfis]
MKDNILLHPQLPFELFNELGMEDNIRFLAMINDENKEALLRVLVKPIL